MSKRILLFYFSGTENTEIVTFQLKREFEACGAFVEIQKIEILLNMNIHVQFHRYDIIGLGFPIYNNAVPSIIRKFIRCLNHGEHKYTFIYSTTSNGYDYARAIIHSVLDQLDLKHFAISYVAFFHMPPTHRIKTAPQHCLELYHQAQLHSQHHSAEILASAKKLPDFTTWMLFSAKINSIVNTLRNLVFGRLLRVDYKKCNNCKTCIENCPAKTIFRQGNSFCFGWKCFACMRCIYNCPANAIFCRIFTKTIIKNRYSLSKELPYVARSVKNEDLSLQRFFFDQVSVSKNVPPNSDSRNDDMDQLTS